MINCSTLRDINTLLASKRSQEWLANWEGEGGGRFCQNSSNFFKNSKQTLEIKDQKGAKKYFSKEIEGKTMEMDAWRAV